MQKILLLTSFILLFNTQLFAQEQKVETPNILGQSAQDLTSQLQKEIEEKKPFDEKKIKIDLESLGLDDVDKKKEEIVAQKPIIEEIKKTKEDSLPPLSNSADLATILKEKPQEINIAKIKEMAEIEVKKIEEKSLEVKKNLVENKQENQASAIVASLENDKKIQEEIDEKEKIIKEKSRKKKEEKMLRLNKLREEYLIKITVEKINSNENYNLIIPQEKNLRWSDRFISNQLPPFPILDRYRGNDNTHIPIILSAREKIDILFSTISQGDVAAFNDAYNDILDPDTRNFNGDTILTYAILMQRHPIISSILAKGADPDLPNNLGHSPLEIAASLNDLKSTQILTDAQADIFYTDGAGRTYLMYAVMGGFYPLVDFFYLQGIDVNASDNQGNTALSYAYRYRKDLIAQYLSKKGAKTFIQKPYVAENQNIIRELENRWRRR